MFPPLDHQNHEKTYVLNTIVTTPRIKVAGFHGIVNLMSSFETEKGGFVTLLSCRVIGFETPALFYW